MSNMPLVLVTDTRKIGGMLATAKCVSDEVAALVVGPASLVDFVAKFPFASILAFEVGDDTPVASVAYEVAGAVDAVDTNLIVCSESPDARIIAGTLSGKLDAGVVGSVVALSKEGESVLMYREIASGKAIETVRVGSPMVAIYSGPDSDLEGECTSVDRRGAIGSGDKVVSTTQPEETGLSDAARVIGVGMGLQKRDDLRITDELARSLGAEIACTLPACDSMHWYGPERVLGSSHNQCAPELYIAIGISGSPNHTSGFRDAKTVVSINNDPNAEIFAHSDYGIVGDLYKIVPKLTSALAQ